MTALFQPYPYPRSPAWKIGIRNPRPKLSRKLLAFETVNQAVATSGDYMQPFTEDITHHHIINPASGTSPPELASCTVIAPNAALADGLATAAMVMGKKDALSLLEGMDNCEGYFIDKNLISYKTGGMPV